MNIDLKQLEKSALDTYAVAGLLGCLIKALRDEGHDSATEPVGNVLCWQLKESLQIGYDIQEKTSQVFLESVEMLEWKEKGDNEDVNEV